MKTIRKEVRGLDKNDVIVIEKYAEKQGLTFNMLVKDVITDYAKRIQEIEASKVLHAQIDDLIAANNELIDTQNQNTLVMGELSRKIISRLDFYFSEKSENFESDDSR
ncbi:hypothetical protein [Leuconostoc pseudomesenteroides]|uniref:hypothetical protein n=1 Tax=Leuconostoc pseudomesenteroides TaxID=33968 RepID=UPI0032DFBFFD